MKKLFMLLVAMAMVTMSFAQLNETPVMSVQNPNLQTRSDWYGFTSNSSSAFVFDAEAEYLLRVPDGDVPVGTTITKVLFEHLTSENFGSSWTDAPFGAEEYTIRFYTGTNYVPTTYIGSDQQEHTYDSLNPGTIAYSMVYAPTETGLQEVTLTTPFTVPSGDWCVSIYCAEKSAGGLCPTNDVCATQSYAYMDDATGWWHYQFGNNGNYSHKPWLLAVYFDDGTPYRPHSDIEVQFYSPDDEATYPDETDWVMVDENTDSLYFYGGFFNMGVDTSYGFYNLSLYIDRETPYYFYDGESMWGETPEGINVGYGTRFTITLGGAEDLSEIDVVLGQPFELCYRIDYVSEAAYNGYDPNLDNNVACAWYQPNDPHEGISENINTLNVTPNPASTYIRVENAAGSQISIYNIAGQEVMSIASAEANETINVSSLPAGLYIVRVANGNEVSTAKVSIVR